MPTSVQMAPRPPHIAQANLPLAPEHADAASDLTGESFEAAMLVGISQ